MSRHGNVVAAVFISSPACSSVGAIAICPSWI
jgi:hypothetical protein